MVGFGRGQGEVMQTPGPASLQNDYKNKVIKQGTGWAGNLSTKDKLILPICCVSLEPQSMPSDI